MIKQNNLTEEEKNKILDKIINMSIITKLLDLKIINEKQYYKLKEEIQGFYC